KSGCGMASEGEGMDTLRRTIAGYARHANFFGVLMLGLGCEANQLGGILNAEGLAEGELLQTMTIQDTGGVTKTVREGVARIKALLGEADKARREPVPAAHITIG